MCQSIEIANMERAEPKQGLLVRLPAPLKRWLALSARLNHRSMNAELTALLESAAKEELVEQR